MWPAPAAEVADPSRLNELVALLRGRRIAVLTGAGCSTESGIPDYRGPDGRNRVRQPIQHRDFLTRAEVRQRYWARSLLGWERMRTARPNAAHAALARLEQEGRVVGLITQNVDRLHHAAGSERVIELHGALARVACLGCGERLERDALQERLAALNPGFGAQGFQERPDGDAELPAAAVASFQVADCERCGGVLKPDVVFFGGFVPPPTVQAAYALLASAEALLVVGSSLAVYSGYRFVVGASEQGLPIGIVNLGETRGDALAQVRLHGRAGEALPRLAGALGEPPAR